MVLVSRLKHFSHSAKATAVLRKIAGEMDCNRSTLVQRVVTRWNSDLRQLQSILDMWGPLQRMAETDAMVDSLLPSMADKLNLSAMVNLLQFFADFSDMVSSDKGPTIHLVIRQLYLIRTTLWNLERNPPHELIGEVATFLRSELGRRFEDCGTTQPEFCLAEMLDPSLKGCVIKIISEPLYNATKECLVQALLEMHREDASPEASRSPTPEMEEEELDPIEAAIRAARGPNPTRAAPLSTSLLASTCEVEVYLKEPLKVKGTNLLEYWSMNREKMPGLAKLARKILAIPASSATSERVFSTAGRTCTERRTSLSVANIEMLVYMKENLRELNKLDISWPGF